VQVEPAYQFFGGDMQRIEATRKAEVHRKLAVEMIGIKAAPCSRFCRMEELGISPESIWADTDGIELTFGLTRGRGELLRGTLEASDWKVCSFMSCKYKGIVTSESFWLLVTGYATGQRQRTIRRTTLEIRSALTAAEKNLNVGRNVAVGADCLEENMMRRHRFLV
jgi:hypothetical protein